ncbi:hypothetical protein Csa_015909 [Cucumis sativus]|uniref:Uncharacterized protein n=1 Tax=Cucumis sativus TaxID=3659 RepID=A0A0A0K7J4_CUCSA|nr:hypothetical protein Csa_015909 [Cucumis sativus]
MLLGSEFVGVNLVGVVKITAHKFWLHGTYVLRFLCQSLWNDFHHSLYSLLFFGYFLFLLRFGCLHYSFKLDPT